MEIDKTNPLLWERVSELSTTGIVKIVNFGKKIPGFDQLSTNDQITLLKASCLEVMVSIDCHEIALLETICLEVTMPWCALNQQITLLKAFYLEAIVSI